MKIAPALALGGGGGPVGERLHAISQNSPLNNQILQFSYVGIPTLFGT
ncbi:hypothetical protein LEP1GSC192_3558 [Leptospira sp. B5-022]|nr:hypothetical protein LEP1GSC192_3558 [Leptospira sp. B5-022]